MSKCNTREGAAKRKLFSLGLISFISFIRKFFFFFLFRYACGWIRLHVYALKVDNVCIAVQKVALRWLQSKVKIWAFENLWNVESEMVMRCNFFFFLFFSVFFLCLFFQLSLLLFFFLFFTVTVTTSDTIYIVCTRKGEGMSKIGTFHHAIVFNELKLKNCCSRLLLISPISHSFHIDSSRSSKRQNFFRISFAQLNSTLKHEDLYFINIFFCSFVSFFFRQLLKLLFITQLCFCRENKRRMRTNNVFND